LAKNNIKNSNLSVVPEITYTEDSDPLLFQIDRWIIYCKSAGLSKVSQRNYLHQGQNFHWWYTEYKKFPEKIGNELNKITSTHIREYIGYLKEPLAFRWGKAVPEGKETLSTASIQTMAVFIKVFFNWLVSEGVIEKTPFDRSIKILGKKEKLVTRHNRMLSEDELRKLFNHISQPERLATFTGTRNLAITHLLLASGMRVGELLSMRLCDIDFDRGRVIIRGKTGERTCFFDTSTRAALMDYYKFRKRAKNFMGQKDKFWLAHGRGELRMGGITLFFVKTSKELGIHYSPHMFRHTFASMLVSEIGIYELKELLGHSSLATTQIYTHSNPEKLQESYISHSPFDMFDVGQKKASRGPGRPKGARNINHSEDK
jgi:site-specific recombinase XerD